MAGHVIYTHPDDLSKWDRRFIELANHIAQWSKGPRKRIGAVITREDRSIASLGYNGPPRGYDDAAFLRMSREEQHKVVIHAEINALEQLAQDDFSNILHYRDASHTLYVSPLLPCRDCAATIVTAGIRRVVAYCGHISPDWRASADAAERIFIDNGVECLFAMD